jgi:hypothetical protein
VTFVDTVTMGSATVFNDERDDLTGKIDMLGSVFDMFED